jgi:hypothetical protein
MYVAVHSKVVTAFTMGALPNTLKKWSRYPMIKNITFAAVPKWLLNAGIYYLVKESASAI